MYMREQRDGKKAPDLKRLDAAIRSAKSAADRIASTMLQHGSPSKVLGARLAAAEAELAQLEADRAALDAPAPSKDGQWSPDLLRKTIRLTWEQLEGALSSTDPLNLRPFLREHIERIVITPRVDGVRGRDFTNDGRGIDWSMEVQVKVPAPGSEAGTGKPQVHCGGGI